MTKPIERVYVVEHNYPNPTKHLFATRDEADSRIVGMAGSTVRVFTEEKSWTPAREPPDNGRKVLAVYSRRMTMLPTLIVARFGSEGKWVAEDHDMRVTYLDQGTVIGWREMPVFPEVV